ncbi:MAG: hypothetical protein KGS72_10570 [Cyanobacteria bacterium REEB67]|nr:hypothetical protein [Cyanobacteria bacterium REEB67]
MDKIKPETDPALVKLVKDCTAMEEEDRPQAASSVITALKELAAPPAADPSSN